MGHIRVHQTYTFFRNLCVFLVHLREYHSTHVMNSRRVVFSHHPNAHIHIVCLYIWNIYMPILISVTDANKLV